MNQNNAVHINKWLLPVSWLYGIVVYFRNKLFDWNILKQKKYDIPVICVGNITVGGTGKTPHIEYLINILKRDYKVAVLSRGYKRKTKGFILANPDSVASQIGDEPFQIKSKFPDIVVAVDANRCNGIEQLLQLPEAERPDIILLDDAFQHRYVKPSYTILLTDYNRLMAYDELLPAGRLREPAYYAEKANMIVITKCPPDINPLEQRIISKYINAFPYQDLFYTYFKYGNLIPVFSNNGNNGGKIPLHKIKDMDVLAVAGIANPQPFYEKIQAFTKNVTEVEYPDHHQFSVRDIATIKSSLDKLSGQNKIIIVTEKDAARLQAINSMDESMKEIMYYLPIEVAFVNKEDQQLFKTKIKEHVRKDT